MLEPPNAAFFDHLFGVHSVKPLHLASSHGDVSEIHKLLDSGQDIDEIHVTHGNFDGFGTALHLAIWCDQFGAFTALLERGANLDILDNGNTNERIEDTPIRLAVRLGRRDMVRRLWNAGAQRQNYPDDFTLHQIESGSLLEVAAAEGQADIAFDLLSWDSNWSIDQRSHAVKMACTAFHVDFARALLAAIPCDEEKLEEIACWTVTCEHASDQPLYSREERVEFRKRDGKRQGNVMAALIDAHRTIVTSNTHAHQGLLNRLLLMAATSPFRIDTLRLLLQGGADPNYKSEHHDRNALQFALNVRRDVETFNEQGAKALLDFGASVDMLNEAERDKVEVVRREM